MHPTQNPYIEYYSLLIQQNKPKKLTDFATGIPIAQILTKIKQFPILKLQQNPTTFAHLFSNIKQIYKKIQEFWNQTLDKQLDCQQVDLVQLAHNQNIRQIAKILNLLIQTLFLSSQRQFFVNKILLTSENTQHYFMTIVESTLEKRKTFSPRKQRQQRLYDKMIQIQHENENLQNLITELCRQKQQIQINYKKSKDIIFAKQVEIKKLNQTLADYIQTPQKKNNLQSYQSQEKNAELAEKFKQKMFQLTKNQQKQLITLKQQVQYLSQKAHLTNHLQNQIEMYKVKLQANNQAIQQYTELSRKYAEIKLNLIQRQEMANEYSRKLNIKTTKLQQTQQKLVQLQLQLQRKNVMIEELNQRNKSNYNSMDDNFSGINSLSLHRTLSQHCPEVANSQAEFLYESNKKLRQQLERSTTTIKQRQSQLQKLKKQYEKRQSYEIENKKLVTIIEKINQQHDEQKNLIIGCLHQLRMKTLNQLAPKERAKRQEIKANLRADNIRVLSRGNTRKIQL